MQINQFIEIMQYMAGNNADRAKNKNDVGFNATDSHSIIGNIAHAMLVNPAWFSSKDIEEQTLLMKVCVPELVKYKSTQLSHLWDESWVVEYPDVAPRHVGALAQEAKSIRENVITIKPHDGKIAIQVEGNYKYITPAIKGVDDVYKKKYSLWFDYDNTKYWLIKDTAFSVEQIVEYVKEATKDLQVSIRVENFVFEVTPIERYILIYAFQGVWGVKFVEINDYAPLKDGLKDLGIEYGSKCQWKPDELTWKVFDKRIIDKFVKVVQEKYNYEIRFEEIDATPLEELEILGKMEANNRRYDILDTVISEIERKGIELRPHQKPNIQLLVTDSLPSARIETGTIDRSGTGTGKSVMDSCAAKVMMIDKQADFVVFVTNLNNKTKIDNWLAKFDVSNRVVANWSVTMPYIEIECNVHERYKTSVQRLAWVNPHTGKDCDGWSANPDDLYNSKRFRLVIPVTKNGTSNIRMHRDMLEKFKEIDIKGKKCLVLEEPRFIAVIDECHKSANAQGANRSNLGTTATWLCKASLYSIQASATPMRNGSSTDMYALLTRTNLEVGKYRDFGSRYSNPIMWNGKVKGYKGVRNHLELFNLCRPVLHGANTLDALEGMPPVSVKRTDIDDNDEEIVPLIREWRSVAAQLASEYKNKGRIPIEEMNALRHAASSVKIPTTIQTVIELIQQGEKVVVYSPYETSLQKIYDGLKDHLDYVDLNTMQGHTANLYKITGKVDGKKREQYGNAFQTIENAAVMLISDSGGESIDLNAAKILIMHDYQWTVSAFQQVMGRIIRDGSQVHDHIMIWCILLPELDDMMWENVTTKLQGVKIFENEGQYIGHGIETVSVASKSEISSLIRDTIFNGLEVEYNG